MKNMAIRLDKLARGPRPALSSCYEESVESPKSCLFATTFQPRQKPLYTNGFRGVQWHQLLQGGMQIHLSIVIVTIMQTIQCSLEMLTDDELFIGEIFVGSH